MSIKTKIVVLLIVSLVFSGIIIGGAGIFVLYQQTLHSTELTMNNQTLQLAGQVGDLLASFEKSGKTYGADSDLQSGDLSRIQSKIDSYFGTAWGVDRLNFIDSAGKRTAIAPYNDKAIGDDLSDRKFFRDSMKDQKSHVSNAIISRATGIPSIIITQPVKRENGSMAGMVLQAVNLDTLQNFLGQVKVGSTGVAAIVTDDGTIIAHSNKELTKTQKKIPVALLQRFADQPGHLLSYTDVSDRESVALAIPIRDTGWEAIVSLPTEEFKNGFYSSLFWMIAALAVSLLIIGLISWRFLLRTLHPIGVLMQEAEKIAGGDLTQLTLSIHSQDEIGRLASSFEKMLAGLRSLMSQVSEAADQVAASSEQLSASTEESAQAANQVASSIMKTNQGARQQKKDIEHILALIEKIASSVENGSHNANMAAELTERVVQSAVTGNADVQKAMGQMEKIRQRVDDLAKVIEELGRKSQEIGSIVETIAGIAGQTNLLALNAAIESARAGEQGRGFAVVADNVRQLAEQSQQAAKQISERITDIQGKMESAVAAMTVSMDETRKGTETVDKAGRAFQAIEMQIHETAEIAKSMANELNGLNSHSTQVLTASQDVDAISREIADQAEQVSTVTEEQAASMEEIAASGEALTNLAEKLKNAMQQFKV
ncbi:MAG: methyl-accepting chemotaxis protein [Veillonellales bacterium]